MKTLFREIYRDRTPRKARGHDARIERLRGRYHHSAVSFLDGFRGESSLVFPLLAGAIETPLARRWTCMAFSVSPLVSPSWAEDGKGEVFSKWRAFSEQATVSLGHDTLSFGRQETAQAWFDHLTRANTEDSIDAIQIGALAGGDAIWVLDHGAAWLTSSEVDEVPFLKICDDFGALCRTVCAAIENAELTEEDGVWTWNGRRFEEGDDDWATIL